LKLNLGRSLERLKPKMLSNQMPLIGIGDE
jgi:hypothetical protein